MKQYTAISIALGLETTMETLDGADLSLNPELAAALELQLFQAQSRESNLASQITALKQQLADAEAAHTAAIDALKGEHATAIENLKNEHTAAIDNLNKEHATALDNLKAEHQTAIDGLNTQLTEATTKVTDLTQRNTDLKSQVEDLQQAQGAAPQAGAQPQTNGMQAPQQPQIMAASVYDPTLSAEENARRILEARKK